MLFRLWSLNGGSHWLILGALYSVANSRCVEKRIVCWSNRLLDAFRHDEKFRLKRFDSKRFKTFWTDISEHYCSPTSVFSTLNLSGSLVMTCCKMWFIICICFLHSAESPGKFANFKINTTDKTRRLNVCLTLRQYRQCRFDSVGLIDSLVGISCQMLFYSHYQVQSVTNGDSLSST